MAKADMVELEGEVTNHSHDIFIVHTTNNTDVQCKLSGKLRQNNIRIVVGDRVKIEVSPYDLSNGRITYRNKI